MSLISTLHSVRRVEHFHVVRPEAVLLDPRVGPSEIREASAIALLAKLGEATSPYLSLVYDVPPAELPRRPHTSCFALAGLRALRER